MNKKIKILLISSSTGGHAIPVLELARGLNEDGNWQCKIVHSGSDVENKLFSNYTSVVLKSGKIHRHQWIRNIYEGLKILVALIRSLWILLSFRPKLIFSKGGFNSVPLLFWARLLGITYYLHETDSEMGVANKMFYQSAKTAFVSFPVEQYMLDKSKLTYSGFIVRDFPKPRKNDGLPILLVLGGSQGAHAINEVVLSILPELLEKFIVVHATGSPDRELAEKAAGSLDSKLRERYLYFSFSLEKVEEFMPQADLVLTRAGGTIADIAQLKKASILVPYPYAASDHQTKNAKYLEKAGGAILIKQENLNAKSLLERIAFIMSNPRNKQIIGENAARVLKVDGKRFIINQFKKNLDIS